MTRHFPPLKPILAGLFRMRAALPMAVACAGLSFSAAARADDTLYRALGEKPGLQHIVDDMVDNVFADPRVASYFEGVGKKHLKTELVEKFCTVSGGPCNYTAHDMKRVHAGLHIDRAAFNAVVEDLQGAMDKNGIPFRTQNRFLARLAPMHREIEER